MTSTPPTPVPTHTADGRLLWLDRSAHGLAPDPAWTPAQRDAADRRAAQMVGPQPDEPTEYAFMAHGLPCVVSWYRTHAGGHWNGYVATPRPLRSQSEAVTKAYVSAVYGATGLEVYELTAGGDTVVMVRDLRAPLQEAAGFGGEDRVTDFCAAFPFYVGFDLGHYCDSKQPKTRAFAELVCEALAHAICTVPRPLVVVESPWRGDSPGQSRRNAKYARDAIRDCLTRREVPFASHVLYAGSGALDDNDPEERQLGMDAGWCMYAHADYVVVYDDFGVSPGMQEGIKRARTAGLHVEYRKLEGWTHARLNLFNAWCDYVEAHTSSARKSP